MCRGAHVEARGRLMGSVSPLPPCWSPRMEIKAQHTRSLGTGRACSQPWQVGQAHPPAPWRTAWQVPVVDSPSQILIPTIWDMVEGLGEPKGKSRPSQESARGPGSPGICSAMGRESWRWWRLTLGAQAGDKSQAVLTAL